MLNQNIDIWENEIYEGADPDFRPYLTTYIQDGDTVRGAVIVLPGGGYGARSRHEAEPVAMQFYATGYHAFVLEYSVAPNRHPQPLRDVSRAICIIRDNAEKWHIDPDKIAVIGFSAGGHLAASIGTMWDKDYLLDIPGMEYGKNKPNAMILSYPVILAHSCNGDKAHIGSFINLLGENQPDEVYDALSIERNVSENTTPAFIWHTFFDNCVPVENSLILATYMRKFNIPCELHVYPEGVHGLSLVNSYTTGEENVNAHTATWMPLCLEWLNKLFNREF